MHFDAFFKQLNIETLYFDNAAWRSECRDADQTTTPVQRVNPQTKATASPAPTASYKRGQGAQPAVGHPGVKRQKPKQRQPVPVAAQPAEHKNEHQAGRAEPNPLPEISTPQPRPGAVLGRLSSAAAVHAQP